MPRFLVLAFMPLVLAGAAGSEVVRDAPNVITLTLEQVKEIRRKNYVEDPSGAVFDTPGLELRFSIKKPKNRHVVEIREPTALDARDSTGTDLTDLPSNRFGETRHVDTIQEWEKPPHAVLVRLALPRRSATSFSLRARMVAVTYTSIVESTLRPGLTWQVAPDGLLGPEPVRVRVEKHEGSVRLVFEPGTARDAIDSVELEQSGTLLTREGTMWNDEHVAYLFTAAPDSGAADEALTARVRVRKGLGFLPIKIDLEDEPLP